MKTLSACLAGCCLLAWAVNIYAGVRFVNPGSLNPVPPYTNWATAAATIQDAVDVAVGGDQVLVTNGIYGIGGRPVGNGVTNRVAVTKALTVLSLNGPAVTVIQGSRFPQLSSDLSSNNVRCVYLTNGALLVGFTLTNGATPVASWGAIEQIGGGASCASTNAVLSNCVIAGNWAGRGGGVFGGTLQHCILTTNAAGLCGGGAENSAMYDCTLLGNSANFSGGAENCTLSNCTLLANSAYRGGGAGNSVLAQCRLTNNVAYFGGAADASVLTNCTLVANSAYYGGGVGDSTVDSSLLVSNSIYYGGGADNSILNNCGLLGNSARYGAGATASVLNNCTLAGNSALLQGGGAWELTARNSILYSNSSPAGANYYGGTLDYCCTIPLPGTGSGNLTNAPLFVDLAGGDAHLQPGSSCIDAGNDGYAVGDSDLDGRYRIQGGAIDIGAYEYPVITGAWPVVTQQPLSLTVLAGDSAVFSVGASGTGPLNYRWQLNNQDISGATNATLTVSNVQASVLGDYRVFVGSSAGVISSHIATLEFAASATGYATLVLQDTPAAYWRLGETNGTVAHDETGAHAGAYLNGVTLGRPGALSGDPNTAAGFGSGLKVDVPFSSALNPSVFTAECWARVTGGSGTHRSPLTSRGGPAQSGYIFYAEPGDTWQLWFGTGSGWNILQGPAVQFNAWTHLAAVYDGATMLFYVNGVLCKQSTQSIALNPGFPLRIGGGETEDTGNFWFVGDVDEVAIYPTALSVARVQARYAAAASPPPAPPAVRSQPLWQTVELSRNVTFSVTALGDSPFGYQWFQGTNRINGATNANLPLIQVGFAQAGNYSVVITNAGGSVTGGPAALFVVDTIAPAIISCLPNLTLAAGSSQHATLPDLTVEVSAADASGPVTISQEPIPGTMLDLGTNSLVFTARDSSGNASVCTAPLTVASAMPPTITTLQRSASDFSFSFRSELGPLYIVEYKDHLDGSAWQPLANVMGTGLALSLHDAPLTNLTRFYRIRVQ